MKHWSSYKLATKAFGALQIENLIKQFNYKKSSEKNLKTFPGIFQALVKR